MTLVGLWVLLGALWLALYPLLSGGSGEVVASEDARRADLEVEKARLIEEIHEARLDLETGKLSPEDHAAIDARLKTKAVELMRELEE